MAVMGPGASPQSLTVLQRAARLYEGARWWLSDPQRELRGLLLLDGGADLADLQQTLANLLVREHGFTIDEESVVESRSQHRLRQGSGRHDCQVTVEERTQLFGFLKKG
jgi:hypothetical protein